ncbi:hypothetical protein MLD38_028778 [Melastoma candidum]|uniref:Uncharacterized protein n=1 Tax=Melastoma candidum TaxID=119954 RepID=A0ACB9N1P3_9MYRT|nr:hypothetical protein MLD38_028778 [Melastoma candidum]
MSCNAKFLPVAVLIATIFLVFHSSLASAKTVKCHPEDRDVLLSIKRALNNPYLLASWNTTIDIDCCNWYCLECDPTTHRVYDLYFLTDGLPGKIPPEIGKLTYLRELTLHKLPNMTGPIPTSLLHLPYLNFLRIDWTGLAGPIPDFLGQLKNLTYLNLSYNKLTGPIPSSISKIPNLGYVDLGRNRLTGTIPASLVSLKGNNLALKLSHNLLTGSIPESFWEIDFGQIELSRNRLEGDLSMLFGKNKTTQIMFFDRNSFEFDFSKLEIHSSLTSLDLSHNKVYGQIPEAMAGLELQYLNVSYNRLCGKIPVGGRLQSFDDTTYFHNRCLCGAPLNITCP